MAANALRIPSAAIGRDADGSILVATIALDFVALMMRCVQSYFNLQRFVPRNTVSPGIVFNRTAADERGRDDAKENF